MSLVNICFFALLLIVEPLNKAPKTLERKLAIGVAAAMLGLNVVGWFLS